jgi:hypothetical protein
LIERYTRVDVVPIYMNFVGAVEAPAWQTLVLKNSYSYTSAPSQPGWKLTAMPGFTVGENTAIQLETKSLYPIPNFGSWSARVKIAPTTFAGVVSVELGFWVEESSGAYVFFQLKGIGFEKYGGGISRPILWRSVELSGKPSNATATLPLTGSTLLTAVAPITLDLECDGRWIAGYLNGQLVGYVPAFAATNLRLAVALNATNTESGAGPGADVSIEEAFLRTSKPFLLRGTNKGDYVLPGSAATYPYGGLHADYYAHGGSAAGWQETVLAPDPHKPEPVVWQEPTINYTGAGPWTPPVSGIPKEYFAVRWYGAVYLDLEHNTSIELLLEGLNDGARLWIGKTFFGEQIIDAWTPHVEGVVKGTVTAASLGAKKGWFPIILEYYQSAGSSGITLNFKAKTGWTDPGGTVIAGETATVIPSTSLSPLGCFNEPIQGQSHFDIIQNTAKQFGYQLALEPKQLESNEFPGQLVPVTRVGKDFNEVIEADDIDRRSGINNYTYTLDATDSAASIRALGSGIADGKGSQVAFETLSPEAVEEALFDTQAFISEGNVAEPQLLAALAEAQLALRLGSWDNLSGEPIARDRLADTFPLTGKLSLLKWRAGDGIRVWLPDVGVEDTTPRAIMQVTRTFGPEGRIGTQIGFRSRPKDHLYALRQLLRSLAQPYRSSQGVYEDVPGIVFEAQLAEGLQSLGNSYCSILPQDRVIGAKVRILKNTGGAAIHVVINGVDQTTALGGPWSSAPLEIPCTQVAAPVSATEGRMRLYVEKLAGSPASTVSAQLILTVLRA